MASELSPSAQRVQAALLAHGLQSQVIELPSSARTAAQAADVLGCEVRQIVKSLLFRTKHTQRPIFIVVSGANRVNEERVGMLIGEPIEKANASFVREHTGFAIGGVAPVGHPQPLETLMDEDLLHDEVLWAAGGTPEALFQLTPAELQKITSGKVVSVT